MYEWGWKNGAEEWRKYCFYRIKKALIRGLMLEFWIVEFEWIYLVWAIFILLFISITESRRLAICQIGIASISVIITEAIPLLIISSCFAALYDKSMSNPLWWGPRSVTRTITSLLLVGLNTLKIVPKGSDRCAQVKLSGWYFSPFDVWCPFILWL